MNEQIDGKAVAQVQEKRKRKSYPSSDKEGFLPISQGEDLPLTLQYLKSQFRT